MAVAYDMQTTTLVCKKQEVSQVVFSTLKVKTIYPLAPFAHVYFEAKSEKIYVVREFSVQRAQTRSNHLLNLKRLSSCRNSPLKYITSGFN